ncbi:hypothetical protein BH10ACI2_BH10ACI2_25500 [soil metagenome]
MNVVQEFPNRAAVDEIAKESGLAVAMVDASGSQILVSGDNSICQHLNPDGKFSADCSRFCGKAFDNAKNLGKALAFVCHAGLECRAALIGGSEKPLVAIVGRTFLKAENYRRATERAISGDWKHFPPSELFENVILTGSESVLDKCIERIDKLQPVVEQVSARAEIVKPLETGIKNPLTEILQRDLPEPIQTTRPAKQGSETLSALVDRFNREVGLRPTLTKPVINAVSEPLATVQSEPAAISESVHKDEPEIEHAPVNPLEETPPPVEPKPVVESVVVPEPRPMLEEKPEIASEAVIQEVSVNEIKPVSKEGRSAEARAWRSFFGSLLKTDYPKAVESILDFLGHQYNFSSLFWLEKNENRLEYSAGFGEMKNRKVRLGVASDDPRLIEASQNDRPLELGERSKDAAAARMLNLFPIGVGGEISAAIAVMDPINDDGLKTQIARICHSIAPQIEILRLRSEIAQGETLSTAVRKFSETLKMIDADDLLLSLTQNAAEMLRSERASLMVFDEKAERLQLKAIVGVRAFKPNGDIGARVANLVYGRKSPVIVSDIATTGLPPAPADRQYKTPSFLSCPISLGGRTIGVMNFADKASGQPFDRSSLDLFQSIAPQLAVAIDRSTLKEKAGEFEQLSVTDALTGLLNRRYIEERLMEEVKRSNRHGFPMSFMMLDVDHFKTYNDQHGHPAGDEALKLVGHVIRETLRGADVAARFGGEEFSILLPQTTADEAAAIAERIRTNIEEANFKHRKVTVSIGVASCSAELCSSKNIVSAADQALYEAKRSGRNTVLSYENMLADPSQRLD